MVTFRRSLLCLGALVLAASTACGGQPNDPASSSASPAATLAPEFFCPTCPKPSGFQATFAPTATLTLHSSSSSSPVISGGSLDYKIWDSHPGALGCDEYVYFTTFGPSHVWGEDFYRGSSPILCDGTPIRESNVEWDATSVGEAIRQTYGQPDLKSVCEALQWGTKSVPFALYVSADVQGYNADSTYFRDYFEGSILGPGPLWGTLTVTLDCIAD
jgi:hypothetical protein